MRKVVSVGEEGNVFLIGKNGRPLWGLAERLVGRGLRRVKLLGGVGMCRKKAKVPLRGMTGEPSCDTGEGRWGADL